MFFIYFLILYHIQGLKQENKRFWNKYFSPFQYKIIQGIGFIAKCLSHKVTEIILIFKSLMQEASNRKFTFYVCAIWIHVKAKLNQDSQSEPTIH